MKSNENKSIKTQIKIILLLLDGSKKTQRQIAKEIGKEESTVSKALKYLENDMVVEATSKIINSGGRKNRGLYKSNLCFLTYHLDNGKNILRFIRRILNLKTLREYEAEDLVQYLHKEDRFLEAPIEELSQQLSFPTTKVKDDYKKAFEKEVPIAVRLFLKELFRQSLSFFEYCIKNEPDKLEKTSQDFSWLSQEGVCMEHVDRNYAPKMPDGVIRFGRMLTVLQDIFKICVYNDVLKGYKNTEVIKRFKNIPSISTKKFVIETLNDSEKAFQIG